jgi:hypothetical protein
MRARTGWHKNNPRIVFPLAGGSGSNFRQIQGLLKTDEQEALFSLLLGIDRNSEILLHDQEKGVNEIISQRKKVSKILRFDPSL